MKKRLKKRTNVELVKYDRWLYLAVSDDCSNRRGRYTVYAVELGGTKRVTIIGRELTLGWSRRVIESHKARVASNVATSKGVTL
jgi:hypothetical protein